MELSSNKYFKYLIYIFLILLIIFIMSQLHYITNPLKKIIYMTLSPLLLGGFLYYLLRPMVRFLTNKLNNRILAIILTLISTIFLVGLLTYFGKNIITQQFKDMIKDITEFYNEKWGGIDQSIQSGKGLYYYINELNIQDHITSILENIITTIKNNVTNFFSTITNLGTIIILIPFVLFYFLKDDKIIFDNFIKLISSKKRTKIRKILLKIDQTLATYISGRLIVSILLGILTYIGFLIINLPNALVLSFIILITSFIPIIGPIFGTIPALFIAVTTNLWLVLKVLIVILIVQVLEGNVIQPGIQGGILKIHPLTVIFAILAFTILFGIIGALFAVPAYVIIRIIIKDMFIKKELVD